MKAFYSLLFILLPGILLAQTGYGIKGGLNYSGLQTGNTLIVENNAQLGWQLGVFTKSKSEEWGFLAEASLITLRSQQIFGDESQKNTVGYLSVPIALQYSAGKRWSFLLGGYGSIRLWANRKATINGVGDIESNIKDSVALTDYGVWAGVGYSYQRFIFDVRYQQGIPNVNTNSSVNAKAQTASGQMSIAYYLK